MKIKKEIELSTMKRPLLGRDQKSELDQESSEQKPVSQSRFFSPAINPLGFDVTQKLTNYLNPEDQATLSQTSPATRIQMYFSTRLKPDVVHEIRKNSKDGKVDFNEVVLAKYADPSNRQDQYVPFDDKGRQWLCEQGIRSEFLFLCIVNGIMTIEQAKKLPEEVLHAQTPKNFSILKANKNILKFLVKNFLAGKVTYNLIASLDKHQVKILEKQHIQKFIETGKLTIEQAVTKTPLVRIISKLIFTSLPLSIIYILSRVFWGLLVLLLNSITRLRVRNPIPQLPFVPLRRNRDIFFINIRELQGWRFGTAKILSFIFYGVKDFLSFIPAFLFNLWRLARCLFSADPIQYPSNRPGLQLEGVKKYVESGRLDINRDLINNPNSYPQNLDNLFMQNLVDEGQITVEKALKVPPAFVYLLTRFCSQT